MRVPGRLPTHAAGRAIRLPLAMAAAVALATGCQAPGLFSVTVDSASPAGGRTSGPNDPPANANLWLALKLPAPLAARLHVASATGSVPASGSAVATGSSSGSAVAADLGEVPFEAARLLVSSASGSWTFSAAGPAPGLDVPTGGEALVTAELTSDGRTYRLCAVGSLGHRGAQLRATVVDLATTLATDLLEARVPPPALYRVPASRLNDLYTATERALRTSDGALRPDAIPDLSDARQVDAQAQALLANPEVAAALAAAVPDPDAVAFVATASATASADPTMLPSASPSAAPAEASASADAATVLGYDPAPFQGGETWLYQLYDADGQPVGLLKRNLGAPDDGGTLVGLDRLTLDDHTATATVELRHTATDGPDGGAGMRWRTGNLDARSYPLPWQDGKRWRASEGTWAIAHFLGPLTLEGTTYTDAWRVDFSAQAGKLTYRWSEWWVPQRGPVRFELADPRALTKYEARLVRFSSPRTSHRPSVALEANLP